MKFKNVLPIVCLLVLSSCTTSLSKSLFCFDSLIKIDLNEGSSEDLNNLTDIFNKLDRLTDNYRGRGINNVYSINQTNEEINIDPDLYNLLKKSIDFNNEISSYFNPFCGSLSKKWKESLENDQILNDEIIDEELIKMNNTSLIFEENNIVKRNGEGEIDLGGITKGFALDLSYEYLTNNQFKYYLINGGKSSLLLGEKKTKNGLFTIKIDDEIINNKYLKLKNCFVSTSGTYTQGKEIGGINYSHIINPLDGSAINRHDAVIVISDEGYIGDGLSTAMMLCTIDEIKELENKCNVKVIVFENKQIIYQNEDVEVY